VIGGWAGQGSNLRPSD